MNKSITVEGVINAPIERVWEAYTKPEHIVKWAFASDDWEAPAAENNLRVGGRFKTVMAAKDKSVQFDFVGTYTNVIINELIEYNIDDNRHVKIEFIPTDQGVKLLVTFELENINPEEQQRAGWQAILDNFKKYAEGKA